MMKKGVLPLAFSLLLLGGAALANGAHSYGEVEVLIQSNVSCNELTDEQLEAIGDYYMELQHPGEEHEIMDQMMGGEGSETLEQIHIQMAKRWYCGEDVASAYTGMMGQGMPMGWMMWGYNWFDPWSGWPGIIIALLLILVLLLLAILLATGIQKNLRK